MYLLVLSGGLLGQVHCMLTVHSIVVLSIPFDELKDLFLHGQVKITL